MGTKVRNFAPVPDLSLEELIPKDSFYRRLEATLDLSFVRELVVDRYALVGRPSVDPVVFFKLQLVLFFEGLRSERQLMEVAADRLSIRWYLGYDLHEPLPDHSSLTRIRERYGLGVFRRFFERIVEMCFEAGLVRGKELFFDSTKVRANADVDSLCSRSLVENHLDGLFEEEVFGSDTTRPDAPTALPDAALRTAEDHELAAANARRRDWISRSGRQDRSFKSGSRARTSDLRVSRTDPDATPMRVGKGETRLGYQTHYVTDGGKARVILAALVTPSEVTENRPMLDLLWRTIFRWHARPHQVTGDAKYGTRENVAGVERAGIRSYVAIPNFDFRKTESGFFGPGYFRYDPGGDLYVCPAGELMTWRARNSGARGTMYRAKAETCNAFYLKSRCTSSSNGRTVYRPRDEDYYDRVRTYRGTFSYEKALRKRKVWVEPLFAEAKDWHGMRRFRLRSLEKVNIEALLIASGQNVKRLLAFGGQRPKQMAQAVALRPPALLVAHGNRRLPKHRAKTSWWSTKAFLNKLDRFRYNSLARVIRPTTQYMNPPKPKPSTIQSSYVLLYEGVSPVLALPEMNPARMPAMVVTTVSKVCILVDTPHRTAPQSVKALTTNTTAKVPTIINHIRFITPCVGSREEATSR